MGFSGWWGPVDDNPVSQDLAQRPMRFYHLPECYHLRWNEGLRRTLIRDWCDFQPQQ